MQLIAANQLLWPLRRVGLDPGRALANANPSPAERERDQAQQMAAIRQRMTAPAANRPAHATRR